MVKAAGQAPADLDEVRNAFRLGWAIAELRGRYRRDLRPKGPPRATAEMARTDDALPLANERSWKEQRIEVIRAITALSDVLKLDFPVKGKVKADQLDPTFRTLDHRATDKKAWNTLTYRFYRWDAQIQDALIMRPSEAAAYQLGRGLAETYWALDPELTDATDPRCWLFLLSEHRRATINRLAARVADYVDPLVLPALSASIDAWGEIAADEGKRVEAATTDGLYEQGLLWRDLIRGERRPRDLIAGTNALERFRLSTEVLPVLWPQLLVGAIAVVALVAGAAALAAGAGSPGLSTALAVLGGLGITSSGLYARAKANTASLLVSVGDAVERDRVGRAATIGLPQPNTAAQTGQADAPPPPEAGGSAARG